MAEFAASLALFVAAHSLPAALGWRAAAVRRIGRAPYLALYSVVSVGLLAWTISAAARAPHVPLWSAEATLWAPVLAMAPACWLFVAGARRANPLSVSFRGGAPVPADPGLLTLTRHPLLWAFGLWAGGHAVANGDLVALILFGGFVGFSILGARILDRRARRVLGLEAWRAAASLSAGPLGPRLRRALGGSTWLDLLLAAALYGAFVWAHGPVIGVDPRAVWGR